jgi:hypothetical protein
MLPMRPGEAARRSHDYKRHGTTSLFAALDIATGRVIGKCYGRHRAKEFRKFLDDPRPFRWTKSADDILRLIERFCAYNLPANV